MKTYCIFGGSLTLLLLTSCSPEQTDDQNIRHTTEQQLQRLTQNLTESETKDDLNAFLEYYDDQTISMPEYQLTLRGRHEIEIFYREIFKRQNIKSFQRQAHEFVHLGKIIVEIGIFRKEYIDFKTDTLTVLSGKYWNVWKPQSDGSFKLSGGAFGYFHPVDHPEAMIIPMNKTQPDDSTVYSQKKIPFELKAYNALMEKGVRIRDGVLRSEFFTNDASVYPFADTTVTGMEKIKPYLIEYSNRGVITIDSIMCYTYDFEYSGDYILEYAMFKVKWSRPNYSGRTEGKGIRIWKRQEDQSLRLYREIGTHNHLK